MPKRLPLVAVVLAAAGCAGGHRAARPEPLPVAVPPFPYAAALKAARGMGDPTPTAAVWVRSRHSTAVTATMGDSVVGNEPVYVAVLTGHFTANDVSVPAGAKPPTGTVATFVYDARTGRGTDFGLSRRHVDLARLGPVHDFLPYLRQAATTSVPATVETQWLQRLSAGSRLGCETRFRNLPTTTFRRRLAAAAASVGFEVVRLQFLRACQLAPLVFIRTRDAHRVVGTMFALEKGLDRVGGVWDYEGFFLEAVDESGKPFMLFWNHVRAEVAGGQWASAPDLYPFAHG